MKLAIFFLLFLTTSLLKSQKFELSNDKVYINGVAFDSTNLIEDYIKVLGQPSRVKHLANNIYVFDTLGLYIYESYKQKNRILELSFDLVNKGPFDFSPSEIFKGEIQLSDRSFNINRQTTYKKIKRYCKKTKNNSLQRKFNTIQFNYGTFSLIFEQDKNKRRTKQFVFDFKMRSWRY